MTDSVALYIHWPFCKSKCPYCDFNSHVRDGVDYAAWEQAYLQELAYFSPHIVGRKISSVFFGGGTPSLMPPSIAAAILEKLAAICTLDADTEVTLEANPTSVEAEKFKAFRHAGINRLSLGVQSLREEDLQFLGREHNSDEAKRAIHLAREIFPRYSFDLIYARPGQTILAWREELKEALSLADGHLSLYQLTIEKGTAFYSRYRQKGFIMPDEELSAQFYEITQAIMEAAGLPAYEISNHAKKGEECRHNLVYWRYQDYLGIGPGAHSRLMMGQEKTALMMVHNPENWLQSVATHGHGIQQQQALSPQEIQEERLMMGLRLQEGVKIAGIYFNPAKCSMLEKAGLVKQDAQRLYATPQGMLVLNRVVGELVAG